MLAFTLDQFRATNEADVSHWTVDQNENLRIQSNQTLSVDELREAAEYDQWFQAQVDQGIREADNPATQWVGHEIVKLDMEKQKDYLLEKIKDSN